MIINILILAKGGVVVNKNRFLAKSSKKADTIETIQEHTLNLLYEYKNIKSIYPSIKYLNWDILRLACIYHDLGKINTKFQNKLGENLEDDLEGIDEIHHGYISPAFLPKKYLKSLYSDEDLKILYQSIYYHHARKILYNDSFNNLKRIIKEDLIKYINDFKFNEMLDIEKLYPSYSKYVDTRICSNDGDLFYKYIITKGLLNKLDYSASAHIPVEIKNTNLLEKTIESMTSKKFKLNDLQEYMLKNQDENNIIIASTGIGKTESALIWIGNNKGFFTLPLKVSINAIYDRVVSENGINFLKENTALLHSDTFIEYLNRAKEDEIELSHITQTKQMSLPLTICTLDQLIDFVFKYPGFEIKLATLAYSKLVIDEIQMYSSEMIGHLLASLKYITDMGGKFSIVTATLPPIIIDFLKDLGVGFKVPEKPFIKKDIKTGEYQLRHRVSIIKNRLNSSQILSNYKNKKVLVIANTVKEAQRIYEELKFELGEDYNINLLHSKFIKKDRRKKEKEILEIGNLKNNEVGIWVSTQIVEASLDIDFDILHSELSDVCGLFQRMGRVYRNRTLDIDDSNIFVYIGTEGLYPTGINDSKRSIIDFDIFRLSKEAILKYENKIMSEFDKVDIVNRVYSKENLKNTRYYKDIKKTVEQDLTRIEYDFKKEEADLRHIYTETIIPWSVYSKEKEFIDSIIEKYKKTKDKVEKEKLKNIINDFTVSIEKYNTRYKEILETLYLSKYEKINVYDFGYNYEIGLYKKDYNFDSEEQFL